MGEIRRYKRMSRNLANLSPDGPWVLFGDLQEIIMGYEKNMAEQNETIRLAGVVMETDRKAIASLSAERDRLRSLLAIIVTKFRDCTLDYPDIEMAEEVSGTQ